MKRGLGLNRLLDFAFGIVYHQANCLPLELYSTKFKLGLNLIIPKSGKNLFGLISSWWTAFFPSILKTGVNIVNYKGFSLKENKQERLTVNSLWRICQCHQVSSAGKHIWVAIGRSWHLIGRIGCGSFLHESWRELTQNRCNPGFLGTRKVTQTKN